MAGHNAVILAVLMLVIGAKLIGDGLAGLSRQAWIDHKGG